MTGWTFLLEISHKLAHQAAEQALRDAGLWPVTSGAFFNVEDRMAEAIRRGAIEVLTLQAKGSKEWLKSDFKW